MSDIQKLIETVKAESLKERMLTVDLIDTIVPPELDAKSRDNEEQADPMEQFDSSIESLALLIVKQNNITNGILLTQTSWLDMIHGKISRFFDDEEQRDDADDRAKAEEDIEKKSNKDKKKKEKDDDDDDDDEDEKNLGFFGNIIKTFKNILKAAGRLALVGTVVIAAINGIMNAFDWFQTQEGSLGDKLMAAVEGFFVGVAAVLAWPFDFVREKLAAGLESIFGENDVSNFLESFTIIEVLTDTLDVFFNLIEDLVQFLTPSQETLESFKYGLETLMLGIGVVVDALGEVAKFLGLDDLISSVKESTDQSGGDFVTLSDTEAEEAIKSARQSKLYDKNLIGTSEIDQSKIEGATDNQLQAILNDEDITDEDRTVIINELTKRTGKPGSDERDSSEDVPTGSDVITTAQGDVPTGSDVITADQLQEVTVPSREYRPETAPSSRPTTLAAAGNNLLPSNVEPVTSLNQVTSRESAERVLSSLTPMLSGDVSSSSITTMLGDSASSTASSVMASALTTMLGGNSSALQTTEGDVITNVAPAGGLATAPVDQASKQVDAAKSQPQVVAVNGGSSSQNTTNVMNQHTVNMGGLSARSQDVGLQRLKDHGMA